MSTLSARLKRNDTSMYRRVTLGDSRLFASFSGDFNAQHLDPIRARRLVFGSSVIHGVHLVLLALDAALTGSTRKSVLRSINVVFSSPVPTGSTVAFVSETPPNGGATLLVKLKERTVATIVAVWCSNGGGDERSSIADALFAEGQPIMHTIDSAKGYSGQVPLRADRATLQRLFPNLADKVPTDQIATLLAATRIVGMECPGTCSIFATFDITFEAPCENDPPMMTFQVTQTRPALKLCSIAIKSPGARGQVRAMFRPPVFEQATMREVCARVPHGSFGGQRVMIVGGSRGLGELSAKIVAAGGGETAITYVCGREDAARVADEIVANGGSATILRLDVTRDESSLASVWPTTSITHLYYFATPRIKPSRSETFDQELVALYRRYYVSGLDRLLSRLLSGRQSQLTLFNPSTIYIDHPDPAFAAYAVAKAESERLCAALENSQQALFRAVMPRLPRLKTDQTVGLGSEEMPDALETLLTLLPSSLTLTSQRHAPN
jgi:acyl dehydratase/NAD(P)-dependent dehydrogenase (short-subunit alcohol dehydrogenase family)